MKIVNVEDFFHPNTGYQVNILAKYHALFGHEVTVITAEMEKMPEHLTQFFDCSSIRDKDRAYEEANGVKIIRLPIRAYYSGRVLFWKKLIRTINNEHPDILYIHGNDTYTAIHLLLFRNLVKCPIVLDSHMVDMASTNKFRNLFRKLYKATITPIIIKNRIPVIRTTKDEYVSKRLGIPLNQAPYISFGSDVMLFHPDEEVSSSFRNEHGLSKDCRIFAYIGKLDDAKGGLMLAEALHKKFDTNNEVAFLIVGNTSGDNKDRIEQLFSTSENKIIRYGTQKYVDLPQFFQTADVVLFPKQCSLSFFDAQACGKPVLSEDNDINVERCSKNNGWNFASGDVADLRKMIANVAEYDKEVINHYSENALDNVIRNFNYNERAKEYEKILITEAQRRTRGE